MYFTFQVRMNLSSPTSLFYSVYCQVISFARVGGVGGTIHYIWEGREKGIGDKMGGSEIFRKMCVCGGGGESIRSNMNREGHNHCHYIDYTMLPCCLCACSHF